MKMRYFVRGRAEGNKIALTFDDGPNPPRTEEILEILEDTGAKATFFVIGKWAERWPRSLERIAAAGHAVGNHSYLHAWHICDYDLAEAAITHILGRPTRYVRAQSFDYDAMAQSPLAESRLVMDACLNPADWTRTDPDDIFEAVMTDPQLGPGAIIDLHDGWEIEDHAQRLRRPVPMIKALPRLIRELQDRGYQLVTLDEMDMDDPLYWTGERDPRDVVRVRMGQLMSHAGALDSSRVPTPNRN
jgi:peptidoglycan/xylan/chitin deacetylase (PgdA/CDA1 family)